jgi:hypothetical protein
MPGGPCPKDARGTLEIPMKKLLAFNLALTSLLIPLAAWAYVVPTLGDGPYGGWCFCEWVLVGTKWLGVCICGM